MTNREKAICEAYTGICFLTGEDRDEYYKYLEELFGRPVYTHEIPALINDIKEYSRADFVKVCQGKYAEKRQNTRKRRQKSRKSILNVTERDVNCVTRIADRQRMCGLPRISIKFCCEREMFLWN